MLNQFVEKLLGECCKRSLMKLPMAQKLQLIHRCTFPVLDCKWTKWPFSLSKCKDIDNFQNRMVAVCLGVRPCNEDTAASLCIRRNREVSDYACKMGKRSQRWAHRITKWVEHLERNRCQCWHGHLLQILPPDELDCRRHLSGHNRPHTRAFSGWSAKRYCEGIEEAFEYFTVS